MTNRELYHYLDTEQDDFLALVIFIHRFLKNV
jgi:hypothetical protein